MAQKPLMLFNFDTHMLSSDLNKRWARRRVSSPPRAAGSTATLTQILRSKPKGKGSVVAVTSLWPALVCWQVKLLCITFSVCWPNAECFHQCTFSWNGRISCKWGCNQHDTSEPGEFTYYKWGVPHRREPQTRLAVCNINNGICNQCRKLSLRTSPLDWCINDPCPSAGRILI